jgi:hypothetical protein
MHQLNTLTQETVAITVVMQQEAVYQHDRTCASHYAAPLKGRSLPLHSGATRSARLRICLPQSVSLFCRASSATCSNARRVLKSLTAFGSRGTPVPKAKWMRAYVLAPLLTQNQQLLGALTLMAPIVRAQDKHRSFIAATLSAADAIHQRLRSALTQESPFFLINLKFRM